MRPIDVITLGETPLLDRALEIGVSNFLDCFLSLVINLTTTDLSYFTNSSIND